MTARVLRLDFATLTVLEEDLLEVVVDDGVLMDVDMVRDYHAAIRELLVPPYRLLVWKKHHYSYTFEAQMALVDIPEMGAMAVLVDALRAVYATWSVRDMPRPRPWMLRIFYGRSSAEEWLATMKGRYACDAPATPARRLG